jgi:hypothetical protein
MAGLIHLLPTPQCRVTENFDRGRYNGADTPDEMDAEQQRRAFCEILGLAPPHFEAEANAPAITAELRRDLLALARRELNGEAERQVLSLVTRFRSIAYLFAEISTADFQAGQN